MSTHSIGRSAWSSTKWLWLFLAISLVAWRVSSRTEQYRCSIVSPVQQAQVAYFDCNERNAASMQAARSDSRLVPAQVDRLFPGAVPAPAVRPAEERQWEARSALPPLCVDSVSLFSNPPPARLS